MKQRWVGTPTPNALKYLSCLSDLLLVEVPIGADRDPPAVGDFKSPIRDMRSIHAGVPIRC